MNAPIISVIVCTYNRAKLLDNCLASLCEQHLDSDLYEVIVVDNNSKDNTFDVVATYMEENRKIRYVTEENQGLSYARNRGCGEARGEYLVYIDDDVIAPPEYLSNVLEVIKNHEPDILGGPACPYYTEEKPRWFRDSYEIRKSAQESGFSKTCRVTGGNFIIKKNILIEIGMFDVELGMKGNQLALGEEAKVLDTYRIRTPEADQIVYYALECYVRHHIPQYKMKIGYMMRRSYLSGRLDIKLRAMRERITVGKVMGLTIRGLYGVMRSLAHEMVVHGPRRGHYVGVCIAFSTTMGQIIEGLNQALKGKADASLITPLGFILVSCLAVWFR